MSKLILVLCLVALTMAEDGFNVQYTPETSPDQPKITPEEASTMFNFIDSPIVDLVWCGNKREVIFMLTEKNTLYRSVDDGFSGHRVTEHLQKLGKQELAGSDANVGQVAKIVQHPNEKNMVLLLGTETINWITEDCGAGFRAMDQGRPVEEFLFHPTERNWILAAAWTKCEDFPGEPCRRFKELFISKNLGGDWELVASYVYQFSWGRVDNNFFRVPKERIIIAYDQAAKGHQNFKNWHDKIQITYSDDFFKTNTSVLARSSKFLVTSYYIFAVQYNDDDSQEITLHVGDSRVRNYVMRPIELPVKRLMEHSYTILDTAEHSVFLHINHDGEQSSFGNIYVSDSTGVRYSTSLGGNIINPNGQCDFERVLGLEGIYLANVIDRDARKRFKNLNINNALQDFKRTFISFNKGGIWQPLAPPERDVDGNRINYLSDEEYQLHLHSISNTNFGPFYTSENSLGLILGTGNIGKYLSNKADEINTYLSRDGGLTWFEIAKGSHIFEIRDHGSIIVMAPDQHATMEIKYSWNEGLTWKTLKISDVPIDVTNIVIEPTNTAKKFIVYGRESGQQKGGAVIAVDFTPLHQRECKGFENPDAPESDYEAWTLNGKISPYCFMGRQVTYTRRKREAECFNNEEYNRWRSINRCQCTEEDWECELGYTRIGTGPCLPMNQEIWDLTHRTPSECNDYYYITQGYRKIEGNSCDGGINHDPLKLACPISLETIQPKSKTLMVLSFILIILGLVGLVWLSNKRNLLKVKEGLEMLFKKCTDCIRREKSDDAEFRSIEEMADTMREDDEDEARVQALSV